MGLTLSKLYDYFDAAALVEGSTKIKCRTAIRKLIAWRGNVEVDSIEVFDVEAWQVWMKANNMRATSIPGYVLALSQVLTWGVEHGLIAENVCRKAKKMQAPRPEVVTFTADQLEDLITAAGIVESADPSARLRWTAMLTNGKGAGPRIGELWNTTWDDIDLDGQIMHIRRKPGMLGHTWAWDTKTHRPRIVPLSQEACECYARLREVATWFYPHLKEQTCRRLQATSTSLTEDQRKRPYGSVFYTELGRIRDYANGMRRQRDRTLPPLAKGAAVHRIRKTAITRMVENGAERHAVREIAGHACMATTDVYYTAVNQRMAVESVRNIINAEGS